MCRELVQMPLPRRDLDLYLSTLLLLMAVASSDVRDAAAMTARRDEGVRLRSAGRVGIVSGSRGLIRNDWCSSRADAAVTSPQATVSPSLGPRI